MIRTTALSLRLASLAGQTPRLPSFFLLMCLGTLFARGFWDEKPWTDWNKREVEKILKDSPWATERWQWRSARPVRFALARRAQLEDPNLSVIDLERAVEDPVYRRFYVVIIHHAPFEGAYPGPGIMPKDAWVNMAQRFSYEQLKDYVFLLKKNNAKVPLQGYLPPKMSNPTATFLFPRFDQSGQQHIRLEDREVRFIWKDPSGWSQGGFVVTLSTIVFQGSLEL